MTLKLFGKLVFLLTKERMEYRGDFLLAMLAQIISYSGDYIIIWLFLKKFDTLAGWSWPEIALLYSLGLFTYAIGASFSFVQMRDLENQVKNGTFDAILIRPVNPYLYLVCRGFNLAYLAHVLISGSVLAWALIKLNISLSGMQIVYLVLCVIGGAMIQAGFMSAIGAVSFVWVRTNFLFNLFFKFKEFISYPLPVFGTLIQVLLTFILPFAFINFYPAAFLLTKETPLLSSWTMWIVPVVGPLVYWLGYRLWMRSVNKYQGAGG
ncbi:ABC transporter permease [Paenibacillus silvae]|uniref:ABC transporter permease n=1 Tax=Paenibacillus silvae TaxID=1325358 RepID=A0ABQ1Z4J6_9BACL|nr:ABC-2 family transporter protein [Paenibacillus silvae]GGH47358.1 ABC transporter permease [Paenibacillus silvae]